MENGFSRGKHKVTECFGEALVQHKPFLSISFWHEGSTWTQALRTREPQDHKDVKLVRAHAEL